MDVEWQVCNDVKRRIVTVGEKDLEDDDGQTEWQNHQNALRINRDRKTREKPEGSEKCEEDATDREDDGGVGDGNHRYDEGKRENDLHAGVEPVDETVLIRGLLYIEEFLDHGFPASRGTPL